METTAIFERAQKSADLLKGIQFDNVNKLSHQVNEAEKRTFSHSLKLASALHRANVYFTSKEGRAERERLALHDVAKDVFFKAIFGFERAHTFRLIAVGKLIETAPDVVATYTTATARPSLIDLVKFAKVTEGEADTSATNTTATAPTEKSATEKPRKFTTASKGIDIRVNSGVTAQDVADAIAYLQSLDIK